MLQSTQSSASRPATVGDMVYVPGGTFWMGSDRHYPEEAPAHRVSVSGFWMDRHPVTNRKFREFVRATGHVTFARLDQVHPHILEQFFRVFASAALPADEAEQPAAMARVQLVECTGVAGLVAQHEGFIRCVIACGHVARKFT